MWISTFKKKSNKIHKIVFFTTVSRKLSLCENKDIKISNKRNKITKQGRNRRREKNKHPSNYTTLTFTLMKS